MPDTEQATADDVAQLRAQLREVAAQSRALRCVLDQLLAHVALPMGDAAPDFFQAIADGAREAATGIEEPSIPFGPGFLAQVQMWSDIIAVQAMHSAEEKAELATHPAAAPA